MAKHIWHICQPRSASTWANWAKVALLHNKSFWDAHLPSNCSWTWRKLLNIRHSFRSGIKHVIGNGRDTFLWFDYWLPRGPIHSLYGNRIIYDSGMSRYARVSSIIADDRWQWPVANSPDLVILKTSIPDSIVPRSTSLDDTMWRTLKSAFSVRAAYQYLVPSGLVME